MKEIVNKFLLAGDKFMSERYLKQAGFTSSACVSFTKNKERIPKFKETGDSRYIYPNEVHKVRFQHDTANKEFKNLPRFTASEKCYVMKHLILLRIQNMMEIKDILLRWFRSFWIGNLLMLILQVMVLKM